MPIVDTTPPKRLFFRFMFTSQIPLYHRKSHVFAWVDLFAAFDTTGHNILITRLASWFGVHGFVLNWFKSYLLSVSLCENELSSLHTSSSQGSILGPLLYYVYIPPFSVLSSPPFPWTITSMLMILNCSFPFIHLTLPKALLTFRILFSRSFLGWPQIF